MNQKEEWYILHWKKLSNDTHRTLIKNIGKAHLQIIDEKAKSISNEIMNIYTTLVATTSPSLLTKLVYLWKIKSSKRKRISTFEFTKLANYIKWPDTNDTNPCDHFSSSLEMNDFYCTVCQHTFSISCLGLTRIVNKSTTVTGCTYCSVKSSLLCGKDECQFCNERSFVLVQLPTTIKWSDTNDNNPNENSRAVKEKKHVNCTVCQHTFSTALRNFHANYTRNKEATLNPCVYCDVRSSSFCGKDECQFCYQWSFALVPILPLKWSDSNTSKPCDHGKGSDLKF